MCSIPVYGFSRIVNAKEREQVMEKKKTPLKEVAAEDYDARQAVRLREV
jgi:hypothetical protein